MISGFYTHEHMSMCTAHIHTYTEKHLIIHTELGMVVHACILSDQEVETGGFLMFNGQPARSNW